MKLLMITRKVDKNEHLAGFIYHWVKKLGQQVDELRVISWQEGDSSGLSDNIKVFHLPAAANKFSKILAFQKILWENIRGVDGIFCHQNPEYTLLAALLAKIFGKRLVVWYAHGSVSWRLKLAEKLADKIISSSIDSFRLKSKKLVIIGQGIDTEKFVPGPSESDSPIKNLLTVGRISPTKDYETMIKAVDILVKDGFKSLSFSIIGGIGLALHQVYLDSLQEMVQKMGLASRVKFLGTVPNDQLPAKLQQCDIFLNLSNTGSLDKAVLEAMSCGCLVLTSNEAFKPILNSEFLVEQNNPKQLAEKIKYLIKLSRDQKDNFGNQLRQEVINSHNLDNLVKKIVEQFN
ncbi:MAG: glycosyltransferase family 4 protein [Patescibacteria group bacterium]|jgi:glycosyltransferase involved in cell wall biosynthesis|nr:glycosyltransferase family 4 protein [Patescibacteria group bacterium]